MESTTKEWDRMVGLVRMGYEHGVRYVESRSRGMDWRDLGRQGKGCGGEKYDLSLRHAHAMAHVVATTSRRSHREALALLGLPSPDQWLSPRIQQALSHLRQAEHQPNQPNQPNQPGEGRGTKRGLEEEEGEGREKKKPGLLNGQKVERKKESALDARVVRAIASLGETEDIVQEEVEVLRTAEGVDRGLEGVEWGGEDGLMRVARLVEIMAHPETLGRNAEATLVCAIVPALLQLDSGLPRRVASAIQSLVQAFPDISLRAMVVPLLAESGGSMSPHVKDVIKVCVADLGPLLGWEDTLNPVVDTLSANMDLLESDLGLDLVKDLLGTPGKVVLAGQGGDPDCPAGALASALASLSESLASSKKYGAVLFAYVKAVIAVDVPPGLDPVIRGLLRESLELHKTFIRKAALRKLK